MPQTNSSTTSESQQMPFPESAWLGLTIDYYNLIANTSEAPNEFLWASIMGVLSFIASSCVRIRSTTGFTYPVLFMCLLGETARTRKTTSMNDAVTLALEPLRVRGTQPGEPDPQEVVRGHGSGEGLMDALADRPWWPPGVNRNTQPPTIQTGRSALFLFDEYGAALEKAAREAAGNFYGFHLHLFDAGPLMQLSTRSNKTTCTNARGTILAASTPDYLARGLNEGLIRSGFVNRFLFFTGQRKAPIPLRPPVDQAAYQAFLQKLWTYVSTLKGVEMTVSAEAAAVNAERYCAYFSKADEAPLLEAATGRSPEIALRLAMVLAFAEGSAVVTAAHMRGAWDAVHYSNSVTSRLLGLMKSNDFEEAERRLTRALRRLAAENGGTFTRSEARKRTRGGNGLSAKAFTLVWEALVAAEDVLQVEAPNQSQAESRFALNQSLVGE